MADATDAARAAADIVLTEPGLGVIVDAVIGARKIFQRMKNYAKYTVAMTFRICFTYGLLTVIYNFTAPTILIVLLAIFNDGAMISLSKDRVSPSPNPDAWFLNKIFIAGLVYGLYLTLSTWSLFYISSHTNFFTGGSALNMQSLEYGSTVTLDYCNTNFPGLSTSPGSICDVYPSLVGTSYCGTTGPSALDQCQAELFWSRQSMLRAFVYVQVSISGLALVFVCLLYTSPSPRD